MSLSLSPGPSVQPLPEWAVRAIEERIKKDTTWCLACSLPAPHQGVLTLPVTIYTVVDADDRIVSDVPACRAHYDRALADHISIGAIAPVEQPEHVAFLHDLLRAVI